MQKNRKPKICFVVAVDITLKFLLTSEIKFFQEKGYDVSVVCSPGKWLADIRALGVNVEEITIKRDIFTPFSDLISLARLYSYFKREKFDLVLTFTPKPGLLGQLAARLAGVPISINTIFGFYFHEHTPFLKRRFFIFIEWLAARCSTFVFFRNKEDFETAQKERIIDVSKASYIGDGIDIKKYDAARFPKEFIQEKKRSVGIDAGASVIGIVARLVREKGYIELFEAFKKVSEKFPDARLLVVGPADPAKKDSINPADIRQKNIIFLGERTDVAELYPVMDIFVLPSYREGFPHSVMEASAMSRPVITTDVRGCRDAIVDGVTGILIPPRSHEALTEALVDLLSAPQKARAMGEAGRKKAQKDFDKNILLQKMDQKISQLLSK